jgi:alkaline phosphatase D
MLGGEQERWLGEGIAATADRWNVIAQQTLMAQAVRLRRGEPEFNTQTWDGYPAARRRLLRAIDEAGARSCVVFSGDAHRCVVADLRVDFSRPRSPIVATELCGPSLTSPGAPTRGTEALKRDNRHIHFAESEHRGYMLVELTPQICRAQVRALTDVADPASAISTLARFEIRARQPRVVLSRTGPRSRSV